MGKKLIRTWNYIKSISLISLIDKPNKFLRINWSNQIIFSIIKSIKKTIDLFFQLIQFYNLLE